MTYRCVKCGFDVPLDDANDPLPDGTCLCERCYLVLTERHAPLEGPLKKIVMEVADAVV